MDKATIDISQDPGSVAWWEQASRHLKIDGDVEGPKHEELEFNFDSTRTKKEGNNFSTDGIKSGHGPTPRLGTILDQTPAALTKRKLNNKRKRRTILQGGTGEVGKKRKINKGRPRNGWTPSRSRKLVRLYLMTELTNDEIIKVLRAKGFSPKIRDVQMQLSTLLGSDPRVLRGNKGLRKTRLRLIRECRALKSSNEARLVRSEAGGHTLSGINSAKDKGLIEPELYLADQSTSLPAFFAQESVSQSPQFNHNDSYDWYEQGFLDTEDVKELEALLHMGTAGFADYQGKDEDECLENPDLPVMKLVGPVPRAWAEDNNPQRPLFLQEDPEARNGESSPSLSNIPSLECGEGSVRSANSLDIEHPERPDSTVHVVIASEIDLHDVQNDSRPLTLAMCENDLPNELPASLLAPVSETMSKSRPKSVQSSIHSFRALGKRLSAKKSESCLEDVWSVLQNLTISSGSAHAGSRMSNRGSTAFSGAQTYLGQAIRPLAGIDENEASETSQSFSDVRLPLPGDFAAYTLSTTYYIGLRRYRSKLEHQEGSVRLSKSYWRTKNDERSISSVNEFEHSRKEPLREQHRKDEFGNSALHIAAALKKSGYDLIKLIKDGVDVHARNSAGETFFHLLDESIVKDTPIFLMLLEILRSKFFDFSQRDCLGQTPFHLLMQPWMDKSILEQILIEFPSLKIELPLSRDSFGCTVAWQLIQAGVEDSQIKEVQDHIVFQRPGNVWSLAEVAYGSMRVDSPEPKVQVLQNYGTQTAIQTVADLLTYERHADLLRTIVRACSSRQQEDAAGRNGLHCLAEVSLTLPLPDVPSREDSEEHSATKVGKREAYLQDLLQAGVDMNNYDKQGYTPLMAFVIHKRDDEDNEATERLLYQLWNSGASIHRRNHRGESVLHMAVQLGKKTATSFLLSKGANVHARDTAGKGVIALALEASQRAKAEDPDDPIYARILLCIDLVAKAGGVAAPTFLQEWTATESKESRWPLVGGRKPRK
ncbi:ankyrin [Acephala macrosclerotiorum]|nr:ankyrin [Acephala macrosclerotiorum]